MASVSKKTAIDRLKKAGIIVDDFDYTLYADADCGHCGSRYKLGELRVHEGSVSASHLEEVLQKYEDNR